MRKIEAPNDLLRRHGLRAKHSWGQNFLSDDEALGEIVAVANLQPSEVVERLAAQPSTRDYGILTVLLNLYFEVEHVLTLPASLFTPPPQVDSAVISLWTLEKPRAQVTDDGRFIRLVKAAFAQRRKTL